MPNKYETQPFIAESTLLPQKRSSKFGVIFAVGLCFILLTGSWHTYSYFSRPAGLPLMASGDGEGTTRYMSHIFPAANGISVTHRQQGLNSLVQRKGHVEIEGTKENDISVIVDFKASSNALAQGLEVSVDGNELIITTTETPSGPLDFINLDVTVQIPTSYSPFVNLSFIYSDIHISDSLNSNIGNFHLSTEAGSITSEATSPNTRSASIKTSAGSIRGKYSLGESLYLASQAGAINVQVTVDTSVKSPKAIFQTQCNAGLTHVELLSPLEHRNQIVASHRSQAGTVDIVYPKEWEGVVEGSTNAGSLRMSGDGLEIVESRGQFGMRYEKGIRGDNLEEKSTVGVSTSAGSVAFKLE